MCQTQTTQSNQPKRRLYIRSAHPATGIRLAAAIAGSAFEESGAAVTGEGFFAGVRVGEQGVTAVDEVVNVAGKGGLAHVAHFPVSTKSVVLEYLLLGQVRVVDAMDTTSSALAAVGTCMTVGIADVVGMPLGPNEAASVLSAEYVKAEDATLPSRYQNLALPLTLTS